MALGPVHCFLSRRSTPCQELGLARYREKMAYQLSLITSAIYISANQMSVKRYGVQQLYYQLRNMGTCTHLLHCFRKLMYLSDNFVCVSEVDKCYTIILQTT